MKHAPLSMNHTQECIVIDLYTSTKEHPSRDRVFIIGNHVSQLSLDRIADTPVRLLDQFRAAGYFVLYIYPGLLSSVCILKPYSVSHRPPQPIFFRPMKTTAGVTS